MAKFQYATKDGKLKTFEAANAAAALKLVPTFSDSAKSSGIITLPPDNPAAAVTKGGKVDVSKVPVSDVKPFAEPKMSNVSVVRTKDNADGTTTNFLSNGQTDTGKYKRNADGSLEFVGSESEGARSFQQVAWDDLPPEQQLARQGSQISAEIQDIETRMANRGQQRNDMLDDNGVFDDLRKLNDLKAELRAAEDRSIEIPIEARQNLRGRQATKTEFNAATRPALENAALAELSASRRTSRLTDSINTNIAIVDNFIEAETAKDEFLYTQKQKRLDQVTKVYGDIITEKQKAALEEKKFQNELTLENIKTTNSLRSDLIKDIAKKGIGGTELQGIMSASIDELLQFTADVNGTQNWSTLSNEQAAMTLSPEDFTKFKAYKELQAEDQKAVDAGIATQQGAKDVITTIENMLNDKEGLNNSVGFGAGNRDVKLFGIGNESAKFRANAKKLTSQTTLASLQSLKSAGATLGAVSEKELQILQDAGQALGGIVDDNGNQTGRFEMDETDFATALETMRIASMKTYIAATIGKAAYRRANYINADFETISKRYNDLLTNPPTANDYYGSDFGGDPLESAFNVLREEEGLRTEAYQDTTGTWTIGFGNTQINGRPVKPGDRLSREQAEAVMQESVVKNYTTFADRISSEITPSKFAALTSFEYNLGPNVWNEPTGEQILALVDQGRAEEAGELMLQYNKSYNPATGRLEVNPVLSKRRAREANLLLT